MATTTSCASEEDFSLVAPESAAYPVKLDEPEREKFLYIFMHLDVNPFTTQCKHLCLGFAFISRDCSQTLYPILNRNVFQPPIIQFDLCCPLSESLLSSSKQDDRSGQSILP